MHKNSHFKESRLAQNIVILGEANLHKIAILREPCVHRGGLRLNDTRAGWHLKSTSSCTISEDTDNAIREQAIEDYWQMRPNGLEILTITGWRREALARAISRK